MLRFTSFSKIFVITLATLFCLTLTASAQDSGGLDDPGADSTSSSESGDGLGDTGSSDVASPSEAAASVALSDDQHAMEEEHGVESTSSTDPFEEEHQGYWFVGAFYRSVIIPSFILELFLDVGQGGHLPGGGVEVTYRKDNFSIVGDLWLNRVDTTGAMRASGDPVQDTEIIDTDMWNIFVNATFLWSTSFNKYIALEYGLGVGLGIVTGDLYRTEAYPLDPGNPNTEYAKCNGPNDPPGAGAGYCGPEPARYEGQQCADGAEHYGCNEGQWSSGGDVPNIVPWIAIPHLALRIKPIKQIQIRIEGGFGLGFFAGGSVAYGFD